MRRSGRACFGSPGAFAHFLEGATLKVPENLTGDGVAPGYEWLHGKRIAVILAQGSRLILGEA